MKKTVVKKQKPVVPPAETTSAVNPGGLSVPGFHITSTSLTMDDSVTPEQAKAYLVTACAIGTAAQWWVGDLLNAMERKWGATEKLVQELGLGGIWTPRYCENLKWVAGKVSFRNELPVAHHMAVATLPPAKQKEMLEQARIGHWNRKMLRDTVAGKVSPPGEPRHTEEPPVELPDEDRRLKFDDVREARKFFASLYDRLPSQEEIESCKDLLVVEAWLEMTLNFGNLINVLENRQRELFEAAEKKARKDRREQHRKEPPSPVGAVKESKASIAERAKKTMTECLDRAADAREAELAAQAAAPPEVPVLNDGTVVDIACKKCGKLWHATLGVRQRCPHCSSSHAAGVIRSLARTAQVVAPADAAKEPAPAAATVAGKWATEAEIDEVFKKNFTKIDLNQPSEGPK